MTPKGWFNVKCDECNNRQDFPTPKPNGWVCGDCIRKPPPAQTPSTPPPPQK